MTRIELDDTGPFLEAALAQFPAHARTLVADLVRADGFAGAIPGETVRTLQEAVGAPVDQLMLRLVPVARAYAFPPISGYRAGAVVLGESGDLIMGANIEFPGLALHATVHGEQAAVLKAHLRGEAGIVAIAVAGTPCGHCRQFLAEINDPHIRIITPRGGTQPLSAMLPHAFMPASLGNEHGLLESTIGEDLPEEELPDLLAAAAAAMARRSYAPYSGNRAGVAVRTDEGQIISAPYLESVAFNPSLSPLQGVLAAMRMRLLPWQGIQDAILVETGGSLSSLEYDTKTLLAAVTDAPLQVQRT